MRRTDGTLTRQQAINEMCKSCIYDPCSPGKYRVQVYNCEIKTCPLHPYRPIPRGWKDVPERV